MRTKATIVVLIAGLCVTLLVPAQANEQRLSDPNDATGPLDIAWIKHGHRTNAAGTRQLVHTVRLFERWPVRRLRGRGFVNLFFDLRGNRNWRPERAVYILYENGELHAELFNFAADPPTYMRDVRLWRPNGRTVKIAFPKRLLRRRSFEYYRWEATSFIEERHELCGEPGGCDDHAGSLRHNV